MSALRHGGMRRRWLAIAAGMLFSLQVSAQQDDAHVAPPPPSQPMPPMSEQEMDRVMDMHDDPLLGMVKLGQPSADTDPGPQ